MEKIKQFLKSEQGKDVLVVIIVILVGLGSFWLGRLSENDTNHNTKAQTDQATNVIQAVDSISPDTELNNPDSTPVSTNENTNPLGKNFFASSRGSKYYPLNCSAGKSIKQENRVYFATSALAEKAGYALSSSCK